MTALERLRRAEDRPAWNMYISMKDAQCMGHTVLVIFLAGKILILWDSDHSSSSILMIAALMY